MPSASAWASSRMISSTPRHCWKSGSWVGHIRVMRPPVCCARRVAKRSATVHSGVLSITTRNLRGARASGLLMARCYINGKTVSLPSYERWREFVRYSEQSLYQKPKPVDSKDQHHGRGEIKQRRNKQSEQISSDPKDVIDR